MARQTGATRGLLRHGNAWQLETRVVPKTGFRGGPLPGGAWQHTAVFGAAWRDTGCTYTPKILRRGVAELGDAGLDSAWPGDGRPRRGLYLIKSSCLAVG